MSPTKLLVLLALSFAGCMVGDNAAPAANAPLSDPFPRRLACQEQALTWCSKLGREAWCGAEYALNCAWTCTDQIENADESQCLTDMENSQYPTTTPDSCRKLWCPVSRFTGDHK